MADDRISDIIKRLKERQARQNAAELPSPEEFTVLALQFGAASEGRGMYLDPDQCRMLHHTFETLSLAVIAVDQNGC